MFVRFLYFLMYKNLTIDISFDRKCRIRIHSIKRTHLQGGKVSIQLYQLDGTTIAKFHKGGTISMLRCNIYLFVVLKTT